VADFWGSPAVALQSGPLKKNKTFKAVIQAEAGIPLLGIAWIPAFAGMTNPSRR
jgi:hypothetical protein